MINKSALEMRISILEGHVAQVSMKEEKTNEQIELLREHFEFYKKDSATLIETLAIYLELDISKQRFEGAGHTHAEKWVVGPKTLHYSTTTFVKGKAEEDKDGS